MSFCNVKIELNIELYCNDLQIIIYLCNEITDNDD